MSKNQKQSATALERGIDRAIAFISPRTAIGLAADREKFFQFSYDAANPGTSRVRAGSLIKNSSSENPRSRRDRTKLIWEARQASNDVCFIRGIMWKIPTYVCNRITYKPNTGDTELDKVYSEYFNNWCKSADITGRHTLLTLSQVAIRSMLIDGDHGALILQTENGIKLQMIEADRIGNPNDATVVENYVSGVEFDDFGKPVYYHIWKRNSISGQYVFENKYPAEQFLHIFDPFRIDQYRGVTHLATAIPHLRDLYELYGYEKTAAKFASMWAAFVKKKDPYGTSGNGAPVAGWDSQTVGNSQPNSWEAQPGRIQVLDPDTDITMASGVVRPSGAFMSFVQTLIREASISLNLPYGFTYDMAALGGATSRLEVQQAQRTFEHWQGVLQYKFLDPIKNAVIDYGISVGEIPATKYAHNGAWNFGSQITADVAYEAQTDITNLLHGLDTATDILARRGKDYAEITKTLSTEVTTSQEQAANQATPMELIAPQRWTNATGLLAAINTPPQPPENPPPGSLQAVGDKGAAQIIEILSGVTTGIMDREAAVNSLITVYQMTPEQAEAIVPPQGKRPQSAPKESKQD